MKKFLFLPALLCSAALFAQRPPVIKITDLEKRFKNNSDTTYVLNFWATWCAPCVAELPYFEKADSIHQNDKVKVLLISMDFAEDLDSKVRPFLERKKLHSEVLLLDETNADYFIPKVDDKWGGALPATVIINNKNGFHWMLEGKLKSHEQLEEQITLAGAKH